MRFANTFQAQTPIGAAIQSAAASLGDAHEAVVPTDDHAWFGERPERRHRLRSAGAHEIPSVAAPVRADDPLTWLTLVRRFDDGRLQVAIAAVVTVLHADEIRALASDGLDVIDMAGDAIAQAQLARTFTGEAGAKAVYEAAALASRGRLGETLRVAGRADLMAASRNDGIEAISAPLLVELILGAAGWDGWIGTTPTARSDAGAGSRLLH